MRTLVAKNLSKRFSRKLKSAQIESKRFLSYNMQDFTQADAAGTNFQEADLSGSRFYRANLKDADFTGATLRSTSLEDTSLLGAVFKNAILEVSIK